MVKVTGKVVPVCTMNAYGRVEV